MNSPWIPVTQWSQEVPHADHHRDQDSSNYLALGVHLCYHAGSQARSDAGLADGVVDDLGRDKVQDGTRYQCRDQVCGEVVVKEALSVHEVEGEVVASPADHEEAGVAQHSISNSYDGGSISRAAGRNARATHDPR
jgi:hypothetical protein